MSFRSFIYAAFPLFFLIVSGCQMAGNTVIYSVERPDGGLASEIDAKSLTLNAHVKILDVIITKQDNGLLQVQVEAKNQKSNPVALEYKVVWMNEEGIIVKSGTSIWKDFRLTPRERSFMNASATSPDVVHFRLNLRFTDAGKVWSIKSKDTL